MKQQSLASFFAGGGMAKNKPAAGNGSVKKESVCDDKSNDDLALSEEALPVKSDVGDEKSATDADVAQSLVAKMDLGEPGSTKSKSAAGSASKRRVVDSSDESDSDAFDSKDPENVPLEESSSETELDDDVQTEVKPLAKKAKASVKKPAAKKAKAGVEVEKLPEFELIDTKDGKQVPYLALCQAFAAIEGTSKRLEITAYIMDFLLQVMRVDQTQLTHTVMLCISKIAPDHEGIELGIGEAVLLKSIAGATGRQVSRVKQDHQELGDLGTVVQRGKAGQRTMFKPKPLSISNVFTTFKEIATTSGSSSIQKKVGLITGLLASCSELEAKYLIRSLEGRLRIGLAESTIQTALSHAALVFEKGEKKSELEASDFQNATESLKQVLSEFPIYSNVIESIYRYGISDIANHCMLTPTLPVKPMLAKIEKAADDILRRFEGKPFTCEFKYDGERNQVHYIREEDGSSKCVVFSRNAENNTGKYPDIVNSVKEFAGADVTSFILDCEAVAWDMASGKIRS
ncbi:ATP-dependent DNA ligase Cdc17, partial [Coemansia sp. RSA 2320]